MGLTLHSHESAWDFDFESLFETSSFEFSLSPKRIPGKQQLGPKPLQETAIELSATVGPICIPKQARPHHSGRKDLAQSAENSTKLHRVKSVADFSKLHDLQDDDADNPSGTTLIGFPLSDGLESPSVLSCVSDHSKDSFLDL